MPEQIQRVVAMSKPLAYKGDGDVADIRYIPGRTLAGIHRTEGGIFVLPDYPDVRTYANQLDQIRHTLMLRGAAEPELVYIPPTDEILDISIRQNIQLVEERLNKNNHHILLPYSHTDENEAWMQDLRERGIPIDAAIALKSENLESIDNRGGWGHHVWDPDFVPAPERVHIPYPVSWIGRTVEEATEAYQRVADQTGDPRVQLKGVFSAGGFVNVTVTSVEDVVREYTTFSQHGALGHSGAVELQGFIPDLDPEKGIFSLQYSTDSFHRHIIDTPGGVGTQILDHHNEWIGNRFNDPHLVQQYGGASHELFDQVSAVLNGSAAKGGLDIGATRTTKSGLVVIEHNAKRMTGAHPAIELMQALGVPSDMPAVSKKCEREIQCDLATLWEVLEQSGHAFDPVTKTGIFPMCWMNGQYGMLMAFGPVESTQVLEKQIDQVYNHLARVGLVGA